MSKFNFNIDNIDDIQNSLSKPKYNLTQKEIIEYIVDLGLPSGTLWCKYNLGVNPNQLSKAEDWYGDYYAWGETSPKNRKDYNWRNYKFIKGSVSKCSYNADNKITKYNKNDKILQLLPEDDAAYQNMHLYNFKFHMPSVKQIEELVNHTVYIPIKNYKVNGKKIIGLNGLEFTSKINDQKLFIPMAGYYDFNGNGLELGGVSCCLWSSTLELDNSNNYAPSSAYMWIFHSKGMRVYSQNRCFGLSVRPVINL